MSRLFRLILMLLCCGNIMDSGFHTSLHGVSRSVCSTPPCMECHGTSLHGVSRNLPALTVTNCGFHASLHGVSRSVCFVPPCLHDVSRALVTIDNSHSETLHAVIKGNPHCKTYSQSCRGCSGWLSTVLRTETVVTFRYFIHHWILPLHLLANSENTNAVYFTDEKCQIFNNAIYDKIVCYCQTDVKIESTAKFKE